MAEEDLDSKVWNHTGDNDKAQNYWKNDGDAGNPNSWKDTFKGDEGDGKDATAPADVTPPDLKTNDANWPLPATGDLGSSSGDSNAAQTAAPEVPDFSVDVGTLDDAQNALLPKANTAVDSYTKLKASTLEKAPWIFQQSKATLGTESSQVGGSAAGGSGPSYSDQKVETNKHLTEQTPKLKATLDNMLLGIADAVHLAGDFTGYINTAAQTYVYADKQAFINPSGTPEKK